MASGQTVCKSDQTVPTDLASGDHFGSSVSADGSFAVVGTPRQDSVAGETQTGSAYILTQSSGTWGFGPKIVPDVEAVDPQSNEFFGDAVDIDGNHVVVGAWGRDVDSLSDVGAAYIFKRDTSDTGGTLEYEFEQPLVPSEFGAGDHFGGLETRPQAVSVDGGRKIIAVGAADADIGQLGGSDTGKVFVYKHDGTQWVQFGQVLETPAGDPQLGAHFGHSVAVDGDRLVVGEPNNRPANGAINGGAAYVFRFESDAWVHEATLEPTIPLEDNDLLGWSVDIDGDDIVVGAPSDGASDIGFVTVFTLDASGQWVEDETLFPSDGAIGDRFGYSARIDGRVVIVGSPNHAHPSGPTEVGAAYVFYRSPSGWLEWNKLHAKDAYADDDDFFGKSVALSGDNAFVGASFDEPAGEPTGDDRGASYVYTDLPNCN